MKAAEKKIFFKEKQNEFERALKIYRRVEKKNGEISRFKVFLNIIPIINTTTKIIKELKLIIDALK